jgi:D-erythro-7,8-dihydroneopterin triphosphate epimerase
MQLANNIQKLPTALHISEARIQISNLRLRTYIGFNPQEKSKKQDIVVSADIYYSADAAAASDNEAEAVNYKTITKNIIDHVEHGRFKLLEKLASDLLTIATESERVSHAEVRVDKPHALRFSDSVSVTLSASRCQASSE